MLGKTKMDGDMIPDNQAINTLCERVTKLNGEMPCVDSIFAQFERLRHMPSNYLQKEMMMSSKPFVFF